MSKCSNKFASLNKILMFFTFVGLNIPTASIAVNLSQFVKSLPSANVPAATSNYITATIDGCTSSTHLDDDCVINGLTRYVENSGSPEARSLINSYNTALSLGNYNTVPECQTQAHFDANKVVGHCVIRMYSKALSSNSRQAASDEYQLCLQSGLMLLVYQGNIAAQYLIGSVYSTRDLGSSAEVWQKAIEERKDTPEYQLLMRCYR